MKLLAASCEDIMWPPFSWRLDAAMLIARSAFVANILKAFFRGSVVTPPNKTEAFILSAHFVQGDRKSTTAGVGSTEAGVGHVCRVEGSKGNNDRLF